jgi:hypothetical protein
MTHVKHCLSIFAAATLLLASCQTGTGNTSDFTKITERDAYAEFSGEVDPTDWMLNEEWSDKEKKLFIKYNAYKHPKIANVLSDMLAYPNPVNGLLFFHNPHINLQTKMDVRFVDKKFNLIKKFDGVQAYSTTFDIQPLAGDSKYVRMYYMLIRNDSCVGKGHGDWKLE